MINQLKPFSIARLPRIEFGNGKFDIVGQTVAEFGSKVLLVTGATSFFNSEHYQVLQRQFKQHDLDVSCVSIKGEPSPQMVDEAVKNYAQNEIEVVLGIGGGSALDAAKAIAGLLKVGDSVMDYLEGVGAERQYKGPSVPFVAVPTTAGTGSEATKNSVLSTHGLDGFKKSFRDENLLADVAIIDPELLASCPPQVLAANGMDALTQLIESYVSLNTNHFTDALGVSGLQAARDGLLRLYQSKGQDTRAREGMAYASLISGINLAQTGLGSVHGLASPLGAFYPIPHGVVCGSLLAPATEININAMREREPDNPALERYARVSELLCDQAFPSNEVAWRALVDLLHFWSKDLNMDRLGQYGLGLDGLDHVVAHSRGSSMLTNPIKLSDEEIKAIMLERL